TYYYQAKPIENESDLEEIVQEEFIRNRKAYGTRKLKKCLAKRGLQLSRRRIGRIMKRRGLTSTYTIAHFKGQRTACNEAKTANVLDRTFTQEQPLE
ncbi:IS3 family transposase, partial [Enterococcus faecium]